MLRHREKEKEEEKSQEGFLAKILLQPREWQRFFSVRQTIAVALKSATLRALSALSLISSMPILSHAWSTRVCECMPFSRA